MFKLLNKLIPKFLFFTTFEQKLALDIFKYFKTLNNFENESLSCICLDK